MDRDRIGCEFCHSDDVQLIENTDAFSGETFGLVWCNACSTGKTRFDGSRPLGDYYPSEYYGPTDRRFFGVIETLVRWSRTSRARKIMKWNGGKPGRILDHGCGRGIMLSQLQREGWSTVGTEHSDQSSQHARALGVQVVTPVGQRDPLDIVEGKFRVVTAWHILEHLDSPAGVLARFADLLEPGGFLMVEVPNFCSFQAQLNRGTWIYTECPRHLVHFCPESLGKLVRSAGFDVKSLKTFSLEYGVFGLLQSLLNLVTPHKNFLFYMLRNGNARPTVGALGALSGFASLLITVVFVVPFSVIAAVAEPVLSLFKKGGVITIIARKSVMAEAAAPSA